MKIQIDTTKKTLKLEEDVKLTTLMKLVKKILPDNEWKEYTLETNTTIEHWASPIIIDRWYREYKPYEPFWTIGDGSKYVATTKDNTLMMSTNSQSNGVYNLEVSNKLI